jgi:hypothetical protein
MPSSRGRCSTCGFLAKAIGGEDEEIRADARDTGIDIYGHEPTSFFCFVNAQPIREEFAILTTAGKVPAEAVRRVFQKDRKCEDWYPYRPGATPLWHYEDLRTMFVEEERRRHDVEMEAQRKEWQSALAEQRKAFDIDMSNRDAKENRRVNRLAIALSVSIGVSAIAVAVIIGAIQIWLAAHPPPSTPVVILSPGPIVTVTATPQLAPTPAISPTP